MNEETIAALATPPGQSGVAVVRVSGGATRALLGRIVRDAPKAWRGRYLYLRDFVDGDELIDRGLVVLFPAPFSYTGEDMAEFHVHGNPFLIQTLIAAMTRCPEVRAARPGEFSYRAYLNGKLDLSSAEALDQLISANSDTAYRLSLNAMNGGVSRLADALRLALVDLTAWVETSIEFAEDQHLEMESILPSLDMARQKLEFLLSRAAFYDRLSQGLRIVIAGPANAGKSSLFNSLLGDRRAIVSEYPGTTRDVLKERFYLHHVAVELLDTAGLNPQSADRIELEGVERGLEALQDASALLYVMDVNRNPQDWELEYFKGFQNGPKALLLNKSDLGRCCEAMLRQTLDPQTQILCISVKDGQGLPQVRALLESWSESFTPSGDDLLVSLRQRQLLESIASGLKRVSDGLRNGELMELLAEDIRFMDKQIALLTRSLNADEVFERIFSSFCIGK